jgi:hypothetical protein
MINQFFGYEEFLLTGFFFPPNTTLRKIVKTITTTATRIPTVRLGCDSPFSMRSCKAI